MCFEERRGEWWIYDLKAVYKNFIIIIMVSPNNMVDHIVMTRDTLVISRRPRSGGRKTFEISIFHFGFENSKSPSTRFGTFHGHVWLLVFSIIYAFLSPLSELENNRWECFLVFSGTNIFFFQRKSGNKTKDNDLRTQERDDHSRGSLYCF